MPWGVGCSCPHQRQFLAPELVLQGNSTTLLSRWPEVSPAPTALQKHLPGAGEEELKEMADLLVLAVLCFTEQGCHCPAGIVQASMGARQRAARCSLLWEMGNAMIIGSVSQSIFLPKSRKTQTLPPLLLERGFVATQTGGGM